MGAFYRDNLPTLRDKLIASIALTPKPDPNEKAKARTLRAALSEAEGRLADLWHLTMSREDDGLPAADHVLLDAIRRVAHELRAEADIYQWGTKP